jgi:DNA ligase (NAD+)
MYSLNKHYPEKDGQHELERRAGTVRTPKLDGSATSLLFDQAELLMGLTRGDGKKGKPITDKVSKLLPEICAWDAKRLGVYQVTGEVVASIDIENSRNAAAGCLNLKEGFERRAEEIGLTFVAYDVVFSEPVRGMQTYTDKLKLLQALGFETILTVDSSKYPTDGEVIRIDNLEEFYQLGYTDKFPRGAIALKTVTETQETTLLDVVWQTGSSGRITPVALLEPVELGGATVSRATLNNIAFIRALDLNIGDTVQVIRSGEIIPKIVGKTTV